MRDRFRHAQDQVQSAVPAAPGVVLPSGPAAVHPAGVPGPEPGGVLPVGFAEIDALRQRAADMVAQRDAEYTWRHGALSTADRRALGWEVVSEVVGTWAVQYAAAARPLSADQEAALKQAVYDALFRAGRLQPLLDDPEVENIVVHGAESVQVDFRDRPAEQRPPLVGTDAELVALVNQLARTQGQGDRALTHASPLLRMRLGDGSRLTATMGVSQRPHVVIRRHRTRADRLEDLVRWGTIDTTLAAFLRALVRARKNVLIAGPQEAGKTSLLRAMAREIAPGERIGTLESEYELWLHEDPAGGPEVLALEARESNGERGPDGRALGELTLSDLFPHMLRMSLRRILVGEVRSVEVLPMLQSMNGGEGGSMATLHARDARGVVERLVTLCLEAGTGISEQLAYRLIAHGLDAIVYVRLVDETGIGGRKQRFVSEILEVTGLAESGRPALQTVFGPREDDGYREVRAVPRTTPHCLADLERAGFDRGLLHARFGAWTAPLDTRSRL